MKRQETRIVFLVNLGIHVNPPMVGCLPRAAMKPRLTFAESSVQVKVTSYLPVCTQLRDITHETWLGNEMTWPWMCNKC